MLCPKCGKEETDNPVFCRGCGWRLGAPVSEPPKPGVADKRKNTQRTQGPMSKLFGYIGFGIGMVLMIVFIHTSGSAIINFIVGAAVGLVSAVIGSLVGGLLDKK